GAQEGGRFLPERPRLRRQAARREEVRRREGAGRQHPRHPARHQNAAWSQRWRGPHPFAPRPRGRAREVRAQGRRPRAGQCRAGDFGRRRV
ncbi:MAG: LSU ribosomal protein L27p, partial [uncultured Acetobacteraceae bacterium]